MQGKQHRLATLLLKLAYLVLLLFSSLIMVIDIPHLAQWLAHWLPIDQSIVDPRYHTSLWALGLLSNFRIQLAEVSTLIFIIALLVYSIRFRRSKSVGLFVGLCGFLTLSCLGPLAPYYIPHPIPVSSADSLKILHFNVLYLNHNKGALIHFIEKENPDLISLQEYNDWWQYELTGDKVFKDYPYHYLAPLSQDVVFSKRPLINAHQEQIAGSLSLADIGIVTQIKIDNQPVTFLFAHIPIPIFPALYDRQVQHFEFWAKKWGQYSGNFVLIGDMNTTPWTMEFRKFINRTHLHDSQLGFGLQPSFPAYNALMRIPIDHCFTSKNIVVKDRHLGPDLGSDHLPVLFRLALRSEAGTTPDIN
jgi:endonuclease/exonuclease/phosphatase (EEP) superfamily protein YafD